MRANPLISGAQGQNRTADTGIFSPHAPPIIQGLAGEIGHKVTLEVTPRCKFVLVFDGAVSAKLMRKAKPRRLQPAGLQATIRRRHLHMATIRKIARDTGAVYQAYIRKRGHKPITKTFKTRNAAERWARKTEAGIEENRAGLIDESARHSFSEAVKRYRAEVLPEKRPETARKYEQHLDHWTEALGALRLSELTAVKIAEARDALTDGGKAPATVNRYLATLASVLTACVKRWHWLAASPMAQVQKPTERNGGMRFLSDDEAARLLKACRESESPDLYLAVLLSLTTGARQGEILGLRWQDLDLTASTMVVRAEAETTTKGGARSLPIVPEALTLLQARHEALQCG